MSINKLSSFFSAAALALMVAASASATTVTLGGTSVAGHGLMSSVAGATTTTFDNSSTLPSNWVIGTATNPSNPVVINSSANVYLAPTDDKTNYVSVGTGLVSDVNLSPATYFGFYWGSVDNYNTFTITDSKNHAFQLTGSDLHNQFGVTVNGNASYFVNLFANAGTTFTTASFGSSSNSFEFDNVATATPEPATIPLMAGGLLVMVGVLRRRQKVTA